MRHLDAHLKIKNFFFLLTSGLFGLSHSPLFLTIFGDEDNDNDEGCLFRPLRFQPRGLKI